MVEKELVQKIIRSNTFRNKEVLKAILEYFLTNTLKQNAITEQKIAQDVFNRKDFDGSEDTIVRVNLFKLRKLLEKYYLTEGRTDTYRISIPKGSYSLVSNAFSEAPILTNRKNYRQLFYFSIVLFLLIWISTVFFLSSDRDKHRNPIWESFNNGKSTKVILCPPYFQKLIHKSSGRTVVARDMTINSSDEIDSISRGMFSIAEFDHPELEFSYFMPSNVYPLPYIFQSLFQSKVSEVELFSLNEFNNKQLSSSNIVFVGSIKTLGYLTHILDHTSVKIVHEPLHMVLNDTLNLIPENLPQEKYIDYALVVKMKGEGGNSIVVVTAMYTTGISGVLNKLEDPEFIDQISASYAGFPDEFEMLVKVSGVNYSNLEMEVLHFVLL